MTTTNGLKVKDVLHIKLHELEGNDVLRVKRGDNKSPYLGRVFVWQEVCSYAKDKLREAWQEIVNAHLMDDDNVLREEGVGEERIAAESPQFSVIVKVSKPRQTFSKDKFIAAVAKRYKIDPDQLGAIAKTCMQDSAPPLHKHVLEA